MIFDKIENVMRYAPMIPDLAVIAGFIDGNDVASIAPGSYEINDSVFVNVEEYAPGDNALFEAHREYIDLQYLVAGNEEIDFINIDDALTEREYDASIDAGFYREKDGVSVGKLYIYPGSFAVFEPRDLHRPGMKFRSDNAKKLIFKIKVK